jgi:hypothetical protein
MESRVKTVVLVGELAKSPPNSLCQDLCRFLGLKPVLCSEIDELSNVPVTPPVLYLGTHLDWEETKVRWPKGNGVYTFIGLITHEFPSSHQTLKILDTEISFFISNKISFEDQKEAFEDLLG